MAASCGGAAVDDDKWYGCLRSPNDASAQPERWYFMIDGSERKAFGKIEGDFYASISLVEETSRIMIPEVPNRH